MDRARDGNIKKWYTITEIIDVETGEILKKEQITSKEYRILKKTQKYEINTERNFGTRIITWECKINEQQRFEF